MQLSALSQLFDRTTAVVPCLPAGASAATTPLLGKNLRIVPLSYPAGQGWRRKLDFPRWLALNLPILLRELRAGDAIHAPIPGDVGSVAMVLAACFRKRLFVRHCGNWQEPGTVAERLWKRFMIGIAGGRNVMLATGDSPQPPSLRNNNVKWIFSTSLTETQLKENAKGVDLLKRLRTRLVITCRQEQLKGTGELIKSLPLIQRAIPKIELAVIGDGRDLAYFQSVAQERKIADRVHFYGNVGHDRVLQLLRAADLFVFPTRSSEGFPKAVLEALACGLPVVSTNVSVLPKLLKPGGGLILESVTPEAIATAVIAVLTDSVNYEIMAKAALNTARNFSLEAWSQTIGTHLREAWGPLIEERPLKA